MNEKGITQKEQHANYKKELWCNVYVAYVSAANAVDSDGASNWADIALKRFDERFKTEIENL